MISCFKISDFTQKRTQLETLLAIITGSYVTWGLWLQRTHHVSVNAPCYRARRRTSSRYRRSFCRIDSFSPHRRNICPAREPPCWQTVMPSRVHWTIRTSRDMSAGGRVFNNNNAYTRILKISQNIA